MRLKEVNWQSYEEVFPEKYWKPSLFDTLIENFLQNSKVDINSVLDVGAGVKGSFCLKNKKLTKYFLDPNIKPPPSGYLEFQDDVLVDFILLRGSVNYLEKEELLFLKNHLKPKGFIAFNSFYKKPSETRKEFSFYNQKGEFCQEYSFFESTSQKIVHGIINTYKKEETTHSFYYRPLDFWYSLFGTPSLLQINGNSVYLIFENK